jgi:hypothetical protein
MKPEQEIADAILAAIARDRKSNTKGETKIGTVITVSPISIRPIGSSAVFPEDAMIWGNAALATKALWSVGDSVALSLLETGQYVIHDVLDTGAALSMSGAHTHVIADITDLLSDAVAGTASLRTLGTGSTQAAAGNHSHSTLPTSDQKDALAGTSGTPSTSNRYVTDGDSRLTNNRTPTSHASSHARDGSDPIDGDEVDVDFTPTNYSRTTGSPGANNESLASHLRGIDNAFLTKALADAKGDLIAATAADTFARLAVGGTKNMALLVDSSASTGMVWGDRTQIKMGSFARSSTGSQAVTGVGFQPKGVLFVTQQATSTTVGTMGIGGMDSAGNQFNATIRADATDGDRRARTTHCIGDNGSGAFVGGASYTSMDTDGFTVNFDEATSVTVYWIAIG